MPPTWQGKLVALPWGIKGMFWLFDYDLTLYGTEERYVIDSLDQRITKAVQNTMGIDFETAQKIRKDYWQRFGTTLAGLQAIHGVNPHEYFDFIHQPEYLKYPKNSPEKRNLIMNLPGHRYVFTNGRKDWSDRGMKSMGIGDLFLDIFDLEKMNWVGKPQDSAYQKIETFLTKNHPEEFKKNATANSKNIIMLDDSVENLEPAHRRGWTTILVNPTPNVPSWVNFYVPHLLKLSTILPDVLKVV